MPPSHRGIYDRKGFDSRPSIHCGLTVEQATGFAVYIRRRSKAKFVYVLNWHMNWLPTGVGSTVQCCTDRLQQTRLFDRAEK